MRTDEGVCPYIVVFYCTEQTTCLLVNQSTLPNHNFELKETPPFLAGIGKKHCIYSLIHI